MEPGLRTPHRRVPPPSHAHVQRLRRSGGVDVQRHGLEEILLKVRRTTLIKTLIGVVALVPLALLAGRLVHGELGANPIRTLEIQTGLWTLRFLAITLTITPARRLTGWNALIKYRRTLGLFTFFYACIHVSMWVGADWFFDWGAMGHEIAKHRYILMGMLTFLLLLPLAVTSTAGWVRRLGGKRWARLHQLVYVAAVTGTIHYLWAVKKDTLFPLVYLGIFVMLLGYRTVAALHAH